MALKKQPICKIKKPNYPSIHSAKIERRKFFQYLGGVASTVLFSSCYEMEELDFNNNNSLLSPDTNSGTDMNTESSNEIKNETETENENENETETDTDSNIEIDTGSSIEISSDDPNSIDTSIYHNTDEIDGDIAMPQLYSLNIPVTGSHYVSLNDMGSLSYSVYLQYENYDFTAFVEENLEGVLANIDELLVSNFSTDVLSTEEGVVQASMQIEKLLNELFTDPLILSLRLQVVQLQRNDNIAGGLSM